MVSLQKSKTSNWEQHMAEEGHSHSQPWAWYVSVPYNTLYGVQSDTVVLVINNTSNTPLHNKLCDTDSL